MNGDTDSNNIRGAMPGPFGLIFLFALLGLVGLRPPTSGQATKVEGGNKPTGQEILLSPGESPPFTVLREYLNYPPLQTPSEITETTETAEAAEITETEKITEIKEIKKTARTTKATKRSVDKQASLSEQLSKIRRERNPDMRCIVATVPDPIDSHLQLTTDNAISAIERGFQRHGFVLDRHRLPWSYELRKLAGNGNGENGKPEPKTSIYRNQPGAILFRKFTRPRWKADSADVNQFVMVLLVGETPTAGLHKQALNAALDFVSTWKRLQEDESPIRILGPEFSGSASSMRLQLMEWAKSRPSSESEKICFEVLSGSATADLNKEILTFSSPGVELSFEATILPDGPVLSRVIEYLVKDRRIPPQNIAILTEANTSYGAPYKDPNKKEYYEIRRLPYPLSVSRVRSQYELSDRESQQPRQPYVERRKNLDLSLELPPYAIDVLPTYSDASLAMTDLTIEQILAIIVRDEIQAVGLFGTDVRDKLVLAQLIRRHAPDVQLFTLETSLLYTHAAYARALKGTIVASTYPLFPRSQAWSSKVGSDLTFPTDTAQGIYNATVAILNNEFYPKNREPDSNLNKEPNGEKPLLNYSYPFSHISSRPPLWLTMVGDTSLWPVEAVRLDDPNDANSETELVNDYTMAAAMRPSEDEKDETVATKEAFLVPAPSRIPLLLSSLVSLLATIAFICVNCKVRDPGSRCDSVIKRELVSRFYAAHRWSMRCFPCLAWTLDNRNVDSKMNDVLRKRRAALLVFFFGLAVIQIAVASPVCAALNLIDLAANSERCRINLTDESFGELIVVFVPFVVIPLLFVGVGLTSVVRAFMAFFNRSKGDAVNRSVKSEKNASYAFLSVPISLTCSLLATLPLALWLWPTWAPSGDKPEEMLAKLAIFMERVGTLSSGVTPLVPLILVVAAICLWAIAEMRRTHFLDIYELRSPFKKTGTMHDRYVSGLYQRVGDLKKRLSDTICVPTEPMDWLFLVLLFSGGYYALIDRWILTAEGFAFDVLFRVLAFFALLCFAGLFIRLKSCCGLFERLLRRLGQHPMSSAFKRVPTRLKSKVARNVFASAPHPGDLDLPVRCHYRLAHLSRHDHEDEVQVVDMSLVEIQSLETAGLATFRSENQTRVVAVHDQPEVNGCSIEEAFAKLMDEKREDKTTTYQHASDLNGKLATYSQEKLMEDLHKYWNHKSLHSRPQDGKPEDSKADTKESTTREEEAEDFVAMHYVNMIRQVFAHIQNMMTFLVLMYLCLLFCFDSYPFQPHRRILTLCFGILMWTSTYMIVAMIKFNRNEVLSHLSDTAPNRITLDRSMVLPLIAYVAVPLISVLIVRFPTLDLMFSGWTSWMP